MNAERTPEMNVDEKVEINEVLAQNNLPADFWVQLFHLSPTRVGGWLIVAASYYKWGGVPALISALIVGILLWRNFPVTIQNKEKTIFSYTLTWGDKLLKKVSSAADKLYERYMNW